RRLFARRRPKPSRLSSRAASASTPTPPRQITSHSTTATRPHSPTHWHASRRLPARFLKNSCPRNERRLVSAMLSHISLTRFPHHLYRKPSRQSPRRTEALGRARPQGPSASAV